MLVTEAGRFGDPEVLKARRVPDPVAGPGQVVVRVAAADVLFVDAVIRSGLGQDYFTVPGGRFSAHGVSDGGFAGIDDNEARTRGITVHGIGQYAPADFRRLAAAALAEAAAGRIRPVIGQTFPLERASDAHAAMEARATIAKTLLVP
ncbi:MAG TPA: zinc-binding dehydrogenase [Trebonia sp.]